MELHIAPVDLVEQLEETAALFQLQARAQRQSFTLEPLELKHRRVLTDGAGWTRFSIISFPIP